jgi:malonyl-CoA O-methyltransferase
MARQILMPVLRRKPSSVLDVGIGTGHTIDVLKQECPDVYVVGLDLAEGMLQRTRRRFPELVCVQGHAQQLPVLDGVFECVISNLAFQWLSDPRAGFIEIVRVLQPNGFMHVSLFTRATFTELFETYQAVTGQIWPGQRLPDLKRIQSAVGAAGFQASSCDEHCEVNVFRDFKQVLQWPKTIGANSLTGAPFLGPKLLRAMENHYNNRYACRGGVRATFEVMNCWGDL